MDKASRYRELVALRKECARCPALANPSRIDGGSLDSDRVGPYSRWQGNLDAEVVVVAQDFADVDAFRKHRGWAGERVGTNLRLVKLLCGAGIPVSPPRHGVPDDRAFFTNAVLCMKSGGMRAAVPDACFAECGARFLRPTIDLVSPKVVVTLGVGAARAVCRAYGLPPFRDMGEAAASPAVALGRSTVLVPVHHPAASLAGAARRAEWERVSRAVDTPTLDA